MAWAHHEDRAPKPPPPPLPPVAAENPTIGGNTLTNRGSLTGRTLRNFGNPPLGHKALLPNCRGNRIGATHPGRGRHTVLSDRGGGVRTAAAVTPVPGVAYGTPPPKGRARQPSRHLPEQ